MARIPQIMLIDDDEALLICETLAPWSIIIVLKKGVGSLESSPSR